MIIRWVHLENTRSRELGIMPTSTIHGTVSAMHKIPLDGTTGTVYHPRATIELALTCNLTSMVARHTGDRDFTV